jgi:hypothetical protein
MQHMHDRQERAYLDFGKRFFHRLASRGALQAFAIFHEARRQRPKSKSGFYGASAQQNLALILRHAADYQAWILIVNRRASGTYVTWQVVAFGYCQGNRLTAGRTEFHGPIRNF